LGLNHDEALLAAGGSSQWQHGQKQGLTKVDAQET